MTPPDPHRSTDADEAPIAAFVGGLFFICAFAVAMQTPWFDDWMSRRHAASPYFPLAFMLAGVGLFAGLGVLLSRWSRR